MISALIKIAAGATMAKPGVNSTKKPPLQFTGDIYTLLRDFESNPGAYTDDQAKQITAMRGRLRAMREDLSGRGNGLWTDRTLQGKQDYLRQQNEIARTIYGARLPQPAATASATPAQPATATPAPPAFSTPQSVQKLMDDYEQNRNDYSDWAGYRMDVMRRRMDNLKRNWGTMDDTARRKATNELELGAKNIYDQRRQGGKSYVLGGDPAREGSGFSQVGRGIYVRNPIAGGQLEQRANQYDTRIAAQKRQEAQRRAQIAAQRKAEAQRRAEEARRRAQEPARRALADVSAYKAEMMNKGQWRV